MTLYSAIISTLALVASAVLLGLHDLDSSQYLAVLVGVGVHVSSVTIPKLSAGSSSSGGTGAQPPASALGSGAG